MALPNRIVPKLIVVDRSDEPFTLELLHMRGARYRREKIYTVAVGAVGFDTPTGYYFIQSKDRNPDWKKPDSDWVPKDERGKIVPGGTPENPLKAAWLGFWEQKGYGIHGTGDLLSLGKRASHGCIRMSPEDVLDLYKRVGVGTPVLVI